MAGQQHEDTAFVRFIKGGQAQVAKLFEENELVVLDFYASWCPPCVQLKPVLIKETEAAKNFILGAVDVDKETNLSLSTKFGVTSIPAVFLLHKSLDNIVFKFVGNNHDKMREMIQTTYKMLGKEPKAPKLKEKQFKCLAGHDLVLTAVLPPPYPDNGFQCDLCKSVGVASEQRKIMHCGPCNFDVCHTCSHE